MANRHIDYIGYIGGLIYANMQKAIVVMTPNNAIIRNFTYQLARE